MLPFTRLITVDNHFVFSSQDTVRDSERTVSKIRVRSESIPLSQMESVRAETDQPSKPQMTGGSSPYTGTDPLERYEAHELSYNNVNVKSGPEK